MSLESLEAKFDAFKDDSIDRLARIEERQKSDSAKLDLINGKVAEHESLLQRLRGSALTLGTLGGILATLIAYFLHFLFS